MKKVFGKKHIKKDGTEGKLTVLPGVLELQRGEETRNAWIHYSALDAKSTWEVRWFVRWLVGWLVGRLVGWSYLCLRGS